MPFVRESLPNPIDYFDGRGLLLVGRGKWRTARCEFHGGSDSMRINTESGGWCCMSCGISGGDVLAYEMEFTGLDFVEAAKALGAWRDDGKPGRTKPLPFSKSDALYMLAHDVNLIAIARLGESRIPLTDKDREDLIRAAKRVRFIVEAAKA